MKKTFRELELLDPRALQHAIEDDQEASERVLAFLDQQNIRHVGKVSGRVLGQALDLGTIDPGRRWREYCEAKRMPRRSQLALIYLAFFRKLPHG